jgi:Zn-dependent protease with chaperone function
MPGGKRVGFVLLFLLGLPLLGFVLAGVVQWQDELDFREQMERVVPSSARSRVPTMPMAELCAVPGAETDPACSRHAPAAVLRTGSVVVGAAGLLLLGCIVGAGFAARADRGLLVALFEPGLRVAIAATIGLIVLHTVLALFVLVAVLSLRPGRVPPPPFVLIPGLFGAFGGCLSLVRSLRGTVERTRTTVIGDALPPAAAPELLRLVDAIADRIGALRPDRIVAGLGTGFFVTEAEVSTPAGVLEGRTLFVSLPMARILSVDELAAIIGHELGHFRGQDTAYSRRFAPIYRGTTFAMDGVRASARGGQLIVLLPAFAVLGVFLDAFARAERHHSRARELLADAAGAEASTPRALASALVKVHASAPFWAPIAASVIVDGFNARQPLDRRALRDPSSPEIRDNLARLFVDVVRPAATPERLQGIDRTRDSHPTDTHPPLAARLDGLGLDVAAVAGDALVVEPDVPASSLFADATAHEERLTGLAPQAAGGFSAGRRRPGPRGT